MMWTDDDFIAHHTQHMAQLEHKHKLGLMRDMIKDIRTETVIHQLMEKGRAKEL